MAQTTLRPRPAIVPAPAPAHGRQDDNRAVAADMSQLAILAKPPKVRKEGGGVPLSESLSSSVHSLSANVLRTLLTMLGIIIGVGAVVTLLAIGNGVVANARDAVTRNGTNLISITAANATTNGIPSPDSTNSLTVEDAEALLDPQNCSACMAVSPEARGGGTIGVGNARSFAPIIGVYPEYAEVHSYYTTVGGFIAQEDVDGNAPVIALGSTIATTLFPDGDAVGKTVRYSNINMRVVGVMEAKGGTGFGSLDSQVYAPLPVVLARFTGNRQRAVGVGKSVNTIAVKAGTSEEVDTAIAQINDVLNARHRTRNGQPDFAVSNQADLIKAAQEQQRTQQIFLLVIAGISLLVGGIGIMNIMLVSVTERTREIGIRKAIGAKEKDIMTQFIVESILISLIGAVIGVIIGVVVSVVVGATSMRTIISIESIFMAMGFAIAVGVFFGVYPARRASRLKPIEALRYE